MFSKRVLQLDTSGIRRIFDLAASIKDPINLSIGQPDFAVPESVVEASCRAMREGKNGYGASMGLGPLREKIAEEKGLSCGRDVAGHSAGNVASDLDVMITSGVSGGLLLSYASILDVGDEILIPDPYFSLYKETALLLNASAVTYDCYPDFAPKAARIRECITERTKALLIASPANPTGYTLTAEELRDLVAVAKEHDLWIISDEIYEAFCYDASHVSALGMYDKLIVLGGYSKSLAVTGWRLGYAIAPREMISQMAKVQQYTFVCPPTPLQWGVLEAPASMHEYTQAYRVRRDLIFSLLAPYYNVSRPQGGFYLFVETHGCSGGEFVERCLEKRLLIVPGSAFSDRDTHFRISFAVDERQLRDGAEVLVAEVGDA